MKPLLIALALTLFCIRPFVAAQETEAPKPQHQHELKQAVPTGEQEAKGVSVKELDAFHADLYMLYHYYMPGDSAAKMKESARALKVKMAALEGASLPPRLKDRTEKFASSRAELSRAVDAFVAASRGDDLQTMKKGAEAVHDKYQDLAKVLE